MLNRLLVFDLNDDAFTRTDVCYRIGKHIGAELFGEACAFALGFGLLIHLFGGGFAVDFPFNDPAADDHFHRINCGIFWEREDVGAFEPCIGWIFKPLCHACATNRAGDVDCHVGCEEGGLNIFARFGRLIEKPA